MKILKIAALMLLANVSLFAHTGVGHASGFISGFSHPIGGLDHLLAMVAVGLWASQLGKRSLYAVPAAFVIMMIVGGVLAFSAIELMFIEGAILASVIVMGAVIALGVKASTLISAIAVGFFAIFHGYAHGLEMPMDAQGIYYSIGFALATTIFHAIGISMGIGFNKLQNTQFARFGGGAILAGGLLLALA